MIKIKRNNKIFAEFSDVKTAIEFLNMYFYQGIINPEFRLNNIMPYRFTFE